MAMRKSMVFEGVAVTLLLLLLFLTLAMVSGSPDSAIIDVCVNPYTYVGQDNTLYLFSNDTVYAIDSQGKELWHFTPPGEWSICNQWVYSPGPVGSLSPLQANGPVRASDSGVLYLYLKPPMEFTGDRSAIMHGGLAAISNGEALWTLPLDSLAAMPYYYSGDREWYSDVSISASGGKVYVFHDYNETIIGENGSILWNAENMSDPAAVGESGQVYCVQAQESSGDDTPFYRAYLPDYRVPSASIEAFCPDGTLSWRYNVMSPLYRQKMDDRTLPLYSGGMVYAPTQGGLTALYANGTPAWSRSYGRSDFAFKWPGDAWAVPAWFDERQAGDLHLYPSMPFDGQGNVYLEYLGPVVGGCRWLYLITVAQNGTELSRQYMHEYTYVAAKDGIGYATYRSIYQGIPDWTGYVPSDISDLPNDTMYAYDVKSGQRLWEHQFNASDPMIVTVDRDNVMGVVGEEEAQEAINYSENGDPAYLSRWGAPGITSGENLNIYPGNGIVYASFWSYDYDLPVVLGKSRYAYVGGLYALDGRGRLLWQKPLPPSEVPYIRASHNGTIIYQTPDGSIGITDTGIATGFTLTAFAYLFLRFFCLGAVARARARFSTNENRRLIYDYIARNPGSTLYEVARGSGLNLGTVRYHAFILGMNHKIASSRMDGKYIRYFINSNSFSKDEQLVLSLMRRDAMRKILGLIQRKPGISNAGISEALDMNVSVVSRCIKELSEKGVIAREPEEIRGAYFIHEAYSKHVADAIKRLQGQ